MGTLRNRIGDSQLASRLRRELEDGVQVLFDDFSRGRYSTDASIYQIEPIGVLVPRSVTDVKRAIEIAADEGVPVLPRGAGTSQAGQAIGEALILDTRKHLRGIGELDVEARTIEVQPGVVLDDLNRHLAPHGLFFPVDVATSSRATLGGMAGNNSAGARSLRYGLMVDNVLAIEALMADGSPRFFGDDPGDRAPSDAPGTDSTPAALRQRLQEIYAGVADELAERRPRVLRHVAGYNLDRLANLSQLLVGSEGTLAFFTKLRLQLQPVPRHRALGICHFGSFAAAMNAVQHIVAGGGESLSAVELIDRKVIELARDNPGFVDSVDSFVRGDPAALLVVEYAGDTADGRVRDLDRLEQLLADHGHNKPDSVVRAIEPAAQATVWRTRKAAMSVVMSMKGPAKPISFIEDCAVPLQHLEEYTREIDRVFERHGAEATWYAHASVGCLHVRPALDLRVPEGIARMRAIAEEAHALVRRLGGSHSGEHGDGIVRSEFLEPMLGERTVAAFRDVKIAFDPGNLFNPGKIVDPPRMDDRSLLRFAPGAQPLPFETALDWSPWDIETASSAGSVDSGSEGSAASSAGDARTSSGSGLRGAAEMCNNNGACLKNDPGVMCPSYRISLDEEHSTRGRANALRLALAGRLGSEALTSRSMHDSLDLCVGCKACRSECPTGVDMARMKIELLAAYRRQHGIGLRDRLFAHLPRLAPYAAQAPRLVNALPRLLPASVIKLIGLAPDRRLPAWQPAFDGESRASLGSENRRPDASAVGPGRVTHGARATGTRDVVLLPDTFNTNFKPANLEAAIDVLEACGYRVVLPRARGRALCCGRTYLSAGLIDDAREEAQRTVEELRHWVSSGTPIVGIEPSCLLTLRDEVPALLKSEPARELGRAAVLLEELLDRELGGGMLELDLRPIQASRALVHGHCHRKAFGALQPLLTVLSRIPELDVQPIASSCCGMAGSFGYEAEHYEASRAMAELTLIPAVRAAAADTCIVADGTSCRHQIRDLAGREAVHPVQLLHRALG